MCETDVTWNDLGGGNYSVAATSEDYDHEVWERPVKDLVANNGQATWTNGTDEYYAYGDLKSAKWGVGTASDGNDYVFAQWEVVGDYFHKPGSSKDHVGLKGHYYFYFKPDGLNGAAIEVNDALPLTSTFPPVV